MATLINTSVGPVVLKEAYEGYEAGIGTAGPWVKKSYLSPSWQVAFPVINALKGGGNSPVPHFCPESPNLRCTDARVVPRGEVDARDGGRPRFNLPVIEATYGVLTWDALATDDPAGNQSFPKDSPGPYTFMEQSVDFDTEVIKMPGRAYKFTSSGDPVDVPVARTIAIAQFVMVRRWQTVLPHVNLTTYLNKLNDATFLGQPRGKIKFRKARSRRQFTSDGTTAQEVEYVFQWREFDHNFFHRPKFNIFAEISDSSGDTPYSYVDLRPLLA